LKDQPSYSPLYRSFRKIRFLLRRRSLFTDPARYPLQSDLTGNLSAIIFINSLAIYILAYIAVFTTNLFVTGIAALANHIPVILYFHGAEFLIRGKDWTVDAINIVFSGGVLFMLILSAILAVLYLKFSHQNTMIRIFILWAFYHAVTRTLGEILVGALMNKGFGFVILYLFIMDTGKLLLTIITILALFVIGIMFARQSLFSANVYLNMLKSRDCKRFIERQFIWPFFAGMGVLVLIRLPHIDIYEIFINGVTILLLIPIYLKGFGIEDLYFDEEPRKIRFGILLPALLLLTVATFRIVFGIGVRP
jgi:hypothetical protein